MAPNDRIAHGYFFAKNYIIKKGYGKEIDWQDDLDYKLITERNFIEEYVWVVLASGMNDKVIRKIFPQVKKALFDFESSTKICQHRDLCFANALTIINHKGKINAILNTINYIHLNSFKHIKKRIAEEGINYIQTFPFMGKATSYHLAKNLGLDVAKPDRHLIRITETLGYCDVNLFCKDLSICIDEKISLIDLVLWRYATLDKNYLKNIAWFIGKPLNNEKNVLELPPTTITAGKYCNK